MSHDDVFVDNNHNKSIVTSLGSVSIAVPPNIIDYSDSDDVKARTGDSVELMCNATGIPTPTITWYRLNVWSSKKKESKYTTVEHESTHVNTFLVVS